MGRTDESRVMHKVLFAVVFLATADSFLYPQAPISKADACTRFNAAVVKIVVPTMQGELNGNKFLYSGDGTGFLVSATGLVLTAGHVLIDPVTKKYYSTITAIVDRTRGDPRWITATPLTSLEDANAYDIALLQLKDDPSIGKLPYLQIAYDPTKRDQPGVSSGTEIVLLGHPSAVNLGQKFCLFGTIASIARPNFFYQAPTVKGMSGGPIISLDSGKVIGLVDKLVAEFEAQVNSGLGMGIGTPYMQLILNKANDSAGKKIP
jgi:hypothetical protein